MCDTFISLPSHTRSGNLIFGKNSDREPDEAQAVVRIPNMQHKAGDVVRCTYISIPQVPETYEVVLSKPFQMWGAEMGANTHGLVIGNEAVFTKIKFPKKNTGLTGMDMLRLALERCNTAQQALELIIQLLSDYGQDACGGYRNRSFFYSNSFLIADPKEAWVLETTGPFWAAEQTRSGFRSISNILTIGESFDFIHKDAAHFAMRKRWQKPGKPFHFAHAFSDWFFSTMGRGKHRQQTSTAMGTSCAGVMDVRAAIDILSTHYPPSDRFKPSRCNTASICMHATGIANPSNTTGSMIAEIRPKGPHSLWLTASSMPCLSVYKPLFLGQGCQGNWNEATADPGNKPDSSLWWTAEKRHRSICKRYAPEKPLWDEKRKPLQEELLQKEAVQMASGADSSALDALSAYALQAHLSLF